MHTPGRQVQRQLHLREYRRRPDHHEDRGWEGLYGVFVWVFEWVKELFSPWLDGYEGRGGCCGGKPWVFNAGVHGGGWWCDGAALEMDTHVPKLG
jgi:hypothetical protein